MRNRNAIKGLLMAAVIAGTACLVAGGCSCGKKNRQKAVLEGHSKAFTAEPFEGITISAGENALYKDREITLTPVNDKTYDKITALYDGDAIKPMMVFELDAGIKSDEYLPGDYEVSIDLNKIGIPRSLHKKVVLQRGSENNGGLLFRRYNTRLKNGVISFRSNQNSKLVLGLRHRPASHLYTMFSLLKWNPLNMIREWSTLPKKWKTNIQLYYGDMKSPKYTTLLIDVEHESGNFRLYFRFRDTEDADRFDKYMDNDKAFGQRLAELEKEAHRQYEAKVAEEIAKDQDGYKDYSPILSWFSKKQSQAIRESISEEAIFDKLVSRDSIIARLNSDPDGKLPKSIETIIGHIIRSNEYLNSIGLHPFNADLRVYLMNEEVLGDKKKGDDDDISGGAMGYMFSKDAFLLVNYSKYFDPSKGPDQVLCTMVHELSHVRQTSYYGFSKGGAPNEAATVVLERDAAKLWYKQGVLEKRNDPELRTTLAAILTERTEHQLFGYPLDESFSSASDAYTLGDAIESIREASGNEDVTMRPFMVSYLHYGPHKNGWSEWIKNSLVIDDEQFKAGWIYFGEHHLPLVYLNQTHTRCPKEIATREIALKKAGPVGKLGELSKPQDFTIRTFCIAIKEKNITRENMPGVFVFRKGNGSKQVTDHSYVQFYWSDAKFTEYQKNDRLQRAIPSDFFKWNLETDTYYNKDKTGKLTNKIKIDNQYQLAAVTTDQTKGPECDYYVAALFAPDAPRILGAKDGVLRFKMPAPSSKLIKEKLITGAVVMLTFKDGSTVTKTVPPKYFGHAVNWKNMPGIGEEDFKMSLHWFYQADGDTVYNSPESPESEWKGKQAKKKKEPEPEIIVDESKGYWKQVRAHCQVAGIKIDEDKITDGLSKQDFRGIEMHSVDGTEVEFSGTAGTEVKENGEHYYRMGTFLDGYVSYTEPPKQWPANTNYTCEWYIDRDPFLEKMKDPFVFAVQNASSAPGVCEMGKDKVTEKSSKTGGGKWLNQAKTVFKTKAPGENDPRAFTITQQFSIAEREGSDLKATVVLEYDYEWVGEEVEASEEDLGDLMVFVYFPLNARDQAYHGEHGGELQHNHSFSVVIPSGSYSLKKAGKGYVLEGRGQDVESSYKYDIQVRAELDKNKIPKNASFSLSGFKNTWDSSVGEDVHTYEARGTADLNRNEMGGSQREGTLTSFEGTIKTQKIGVFSYGNAEAKNSDGYEYGYVAIRWNL